MAVECFLTGAYRLTPASQVIVSDLSDVKVGANTVWNHQNKPTGDQIAVDPVLGRIVFATPPTLSPPPRGNFHLGFSFDLGGGEYSRAQSFEADIAVAAQVPHDPAASRPSFDTLTAALN